MRCWRIYPCVKNVWEEQYSTVSPVPCSQRDYPGYARDTALDRNPKYELLSRVVGSQIHDGVFLILHFLFHLLEDLRWRNQHSSASLVSLTPHSYSTV